jgi:hypothetical protein
MRHRYNAADRKTRKLRRMFALTRPELRHSDGLLRAASSATGPMVKVLDQDTQRLIDEALAKRRGEGRL